MAQLRMLLSLMSWLTVFVTALVPMVAALLLLQGVRTGAPLALAVTDQLGTLGVGGLALMLALAPWWALAAAAVRRDRLRRGVPRA